MFVCKGANLNAYFNVIPVSDQSVANVITR